MFPAAEGEQLIARILNSIPQNQLKSFLGCSKTQAEQLVAGNLVNSVVPVAEGKCGLSVGAYNRDELREFLVRATAGVTEVSEEGDGFLDLTRACKGRSSTAELIRWQMEGKLRKTRLIGPRHRLDSLRFSLEEVRVLVHARSRTDLNRLTSAAVLLRVNLEVVKRLVSRGGNWPTLALASAAECRGLHAEAYVSSAEIERFTKTYLPLAWAADVLGVHPATAAKVLASDVLPVCDPRELGTRLYRRREVEAFVARAGRRQGVHEPCHEVAADVSKRPEDDLERQEGVHLVKPMLPAGESDASSGVVAGRSVQRIQ
ncbi:hypothetical protein [Rhodobacter sp. CZR27]|uniref:hypothetical protein n=1 Tax=Rhodobacter sp. CZR27 TaxID=2033869 RepID=UPI000BBE73BF|nr:hypothetical protein [Rhodobacter sp. CZR27]